ncbi:MAG: IS30 family transposase [Candidatus Azotimanducaceae bacterium]|jgi:IS30 family transposase
MDSQIQQKVLRHLTEDQWSPETISAALYLEYKLKASAKAIYKYIKKRCLEYLLARYHKRKGKKRVNSGLLIVSSSLTPSVYEKAMDTGRVTSLFLPKGQEYSWCW